MGANEVGARGLSGNVTGVKLVSNKTVSGSSAPTVKNTATAHNIGIVKTGGQIDFDGTNSYATHKMSLETQDIAALASQTDLFAKFKSNDDIFKKPIAYKESEASIKIKTDLSSLDYFYDNNRGLDEIKIQKENFLGDDDMFSENPFPISLIQQNSVKEKKWATIDDILKNAYNDGSTGHGDLSNDSYYQPGTNDRIVLIEHDTDGKFTPNFKQYSWLSDEARGLLDKKKEQKILVTKHRVRLKDSL